MPKIPCILREINSSDFLIHSNDEEWAFINEISHGKKIAFRFNNISIIGTIPMDVSINSVAFRLFAAKNSYVVGDKCYPVSGNGTLPAEFMDDKGLEKHASRTHITYESKIDIDRTVVACGNLYFFNYSHFLTQVTPVIVALHRRAKMDNENICFVTPPLKSWQRNVFKAIGIRDDDIIEKKVSDIVCARNVIFGTTQFCVPHSQVINNGFMRECVSCITENIGNMRTLEKIFITRKTSAARKLRNSDEIAAVLRKYGLKEIELDGMEFEEQIRLFAGCKLVVAEHGAGLTNIIFCQPGTKILELMPYKFSNTAYPVLSEIFGLSHNRLIGSILDGNDSWFIDPKILSSGPVDMLLKE